MKGRNKNMNLYVAKIRDTENGTTLEGYHYRKNPTPKSEYDKYIGVYSSIYLKGVHDVTVEFGKPLAVTYDFKEKVFKLDNK